MWGPLLVLALLFTINPVRLAIILLVLSRPRPMQNLLAYWLGILLVGFAFLIVPLVVLHSTPTLASFARRFTQPTANPVAQGIAIGIGVLLLSIATLMVLRFPARARGDGGGHIPDRNGNTNTSTLTLDPATLPIISRLMRPVSDAMPEGNSRLRRLFGRARDAWQNGSPRIAFIIGLMVMPADGVLFALALIVTSGAAIEMQIGAAIAFVIVTLMIEESILVSNLFAPEKTQLALRRLHDWAIAHNRKVVTATLAVVGASLMIRGMGGL